MNLVFWPLSWRTDYDQPAGRFENWLRWRVAIAPAHALLFVPRATHLAAVQAELDALRT
jgi:hypothetical protein